jgi:hypothetical protein
MLQADAYLELITPARAALLKKSVVLARDLKPEFQDVTYEELAVEIAVCLAFSMIEAQEKLTFLIDGETIIGDGALSERSDSRYGESDTSFYRWHHRLR